METSEIHILANLLPQHPEGRGCRCVWLGLDISVLFELSCLLCEPSTPASFSLGRWCLQRRVCFLALGLGLRMSAGGDRKVRNPGASIKMEDYSNQHRGQHVTSAFTLVAFQTRPEVGG